MGRRRAIFTFALVSFSMSGTAKVKKFRANATVFAEIYGIGLHGVDKAGTKVGKGPQTPIELLAPLDLDYFPTTAWTEFPDSRAETCRRPTVLQGANPTG
jgi:hypothetical protein